MRQRHVPEELFRKFLGLKTSKKENRRIVGHLLTGCRPCLHLAARAASEAGLFSTGPAGGADVYEVVFDRALEYASREERRLAVEKLHGWAQWAFLEALRPDERTLWVQTDPAFQTWSLYHRLLEAGRWYLRQDPAEAVDIGHLAIQVAERLDPSEMEPERVADLQAAAWAALANTQRVAGDFDGARQAFNQAWRILEERGTNDPLERASLLSLEASYIKDVGEFETAEAILEEALDLYRVARDVHMQGRVLVQMGEIIGHVVPERGILHIRKALALIDISQEPRLEVCAQHALAWFLTDLGRPEDALAVLDRARPLYAQSQDELIQLRLHWLEAKIAHRRGDLAAAASIFQQLWEELRVRDLNQEVVLVSIELAEVFTKQGEAARAADLAAGCYTIMRSWGLHKDALAAWIVFQESLQALRQDGQALGDLCGRIEEYFRRHWVRPAGFVA
jgi:tetratricopeptide (TPR) repeat protein